MKPLKIILGIIGGAVVITGGLALKSKIAYDQDGQAITKLIAEYKALGVPTTRAEFEKLYPEVVITKSDEQEMMAEIQQPIRSQLRPIVLACLPSDRPFLDKYLLKSKKQREDFMSGRMVRHLLNIDDSLVLSFCLAAQSSSYKNDSAATEANLNQALSVINRDMARPKFTDAYVGIYMSRYILQTCLRIIEQSPKMTPKILAIMERPNLIAKANARGMIFEQFLQDIVAARHLDSPLLDKKRPPAVLRRFIKVPTDEEIIESLKKHEDDYMPESRGARLILRERLASWKPLVTQMAKGSDPTIQPNSEELDGADSLSNEVPGDLAKLYNQDENLTHPKGTMHTDRDFRIFFQIVTSALKIKSINGKFPEKLAEVSLAANPNDYHYQTIPGGFKAEIIWHDAKRPSYVHYRISYPLEASTKAGLMASYRNQIAKAKKELDSPSPKN